MFTLWYNWDLTQLTFNSFKLGPKTLYFRKTKIFAVFYFQTRKFTSCHGDTQSLCSLPFKSLGKLLPSSALGSFLFFLCPFVYIFFSFFFLALYLRFIIMDQMRLKWERTTFNKTYYVLEHSLIWFAWNRSSFRSNIMSTTTSLSNWITSYRRLYMRIYKPHSKTNI